MMGKGENCLAMEAIRILSGSLKQDKGQKGVLGSFIKSLPDSFSLLEAESNFLMTLEDSGSGVF